MLGATREGQKKRAVLILNPIAGRGFSSSFLEAAREELASAGYDLAVRPTESPEHARQVASESQYDADLIIVGGGDGTISQVVRGLELGRIPIAILPLGTANVLAQELNIGLSPRKALQAILKGKEKKWDVGLANGVRFVSFVGAGFDACVTSEVHRARTGNIGYEHYLWPLMKVYSSWKSPSIHVEIDGTPFPKPVSQVIVSNLKRYASFFELTPDIRPDDGLLDVCLFSRPGRMHLFRYAASMFLRLLPQLEDATFLRGKRIELRSTDKVPYQIDGDPAGELPLVITLEKKPLKIIAAFESFEGTTVKSGAGG